MILARLKGCLTVFDFYGKRLFNVRQHKIDLVTVGSAPIKHFLFSVPSVKRFITGCFPDVAFVEPFRNGLKTRTPWRRALSLSLILYFSVFSAIAQRRITGVITDTSGSPIATYTFDPYEPRWIIGLIDLPQPVSGRYIRIEININLQYATLGELFVFGKK
jgi:hypothetical protein